MTSDEFRAMALSFANAKFVSVFGVIEFWINGAPFASLGSPNPALAVIRLSREDQAALIAAAPRVFSPAPSGAGGRGVTQVRLAKADSAHVQRALRAAYAAAAGSSRSEPRDG